MTRTAVIVGGGPAGLTAAYELQRSSDVRPLVFEMGEQVGGISRTINYRGNRTVVHSGQGSLTFNSANLNSVNKTSHFGTTNNSLADLLLGLPYQTARQPTAPRVDLPDGVRSRPPRDRF